MTQESLCKCGKPEGHMVHAETSDQRAGNVVGHAFEPAACPHGCVDGVIVTAPDLMRHAEDYFRRCPLHGPTEPRKDAGREDAPSVENLQKALAAHAILAYTVRAYCRMQCDATYQAMLGALKAIEGKS